MSQNISRDSMTRRTALAAGAGALASGTAVAQQTGPTPTPSLSKTFVLVHGAWHGGWCWRRVADRLEGKGHKVYAPTLTGLADRSHLLSKDINLDTHIADVAGLLQWEDLGGVCLVGHSYGGWPVSGALEKIGDRIASLVLLDAFKPEDGQRGADFASAFSRKAMDEAIARGEFSRPAPKAAQFLVNEKDQAWVDSKTTPQPNGVALQPIRLTGAREKVAKKLYIRAPKYPQPAFDKALAECKADASWKTLTTEAGHDVMVDDPQWLSEVLLEHA